MQTPFVATSPLEEAWPWCSRFSTGMNQSTCRADQQLVTARGCSHGEGSGSNFFPFLPLLLPSAPICAPLPPTFLQLQSPVKNFGE